MSVLLIDTSAGTLLFSETVQLENIEYVFDFFWSSREGFLYFNLLDQNSNIIAPWVKCVVGFPILSRFKDPRLPPGELLCVDTSGQGLDAQFPEEFRTRVQIQYITSDDPILNPAQ